MGVASLPPCLHTALCNLQHFHLFRTLAKLAGFVGILHAEFQMRPAGGFSFISESRVWRREIYLKTVPWLLLAVAVPDRHACPCSRGRCLLWKLRTAHTDVCVGRMLCEEGIGSARHWFCLKIPQI